MVRTPSTMLPLGTPAPNFSLVDAVSGKTIGLADFKDAQALLVMFICNHCPFVKHVAAELAKLGDDYLPKNVAIVAINSNDVTAHPDDAPDKMRAEAQARGYKFPYLFDDTQSVAHAYHAACTPDFFLFDHQQKLAYRGQLDGSRPGNDVPVNGADLRAAINALLDGEHVPTEQRASLGCNIKWKPGNEPEHFKS